MLFEPAGDGAHEVLAPGFAFPVVGLSAGCWVGASDGVDGVLEHDLRHGGGWRGGEGDVDVFDCGVIAGVSENGILGLLGSMGRG